jgi:hypothetical protein
MRVQAKWKPMVLPVELIDEAISLLLSFLQQRRERGREGERKRES